MVAAMNLFRVLQRMLFSFETSTQDLDSERFSTSAKSNRKKILKMQVSGRQQSDKACLTLQFASVGGGQVELHLARKMT